MLLAGARLKREAAGQLSLHATAARGKPEAIRKILKDAERE
jgi:hypothetical protein